MSQLPFERLFSMGAFDALRSIRRLACRLEGLETESIASLLKQTNSEMSGLDFAAALELDGVIPKDASVDIPHEFYRLCISCVIVTQGKSWSKSITLGRSRFLNQLSRDEHLCFRAALLTDSPPADDIVEWWDAIAAKMRQTSDLIRMDRARHAERLTLCFERARLSRLAIEIEPRWIAIEDNTAGYDVLSYDPGAFGPTNRLIEVKSTIASPLRFFVTRNEWEKALKFGAAYHFHIWDLAAIPPRLYERTSATIHPHIPNDQAHGKWATAEIPVGPLDS